MIDAAPLVDGGCGENVAAMGRYSGWKVLVVSAHIGDEILGCET